MSNAQLFLGGSVNFATTGGKTKTQPTTGSTVTVDDNKTYNTTFAPKIGLLLSEKLAVGTNLIVGNSINNNPNTNTSTYTGTLGIAPFARYYAVKGEKFKIFAEAELGLTRSADRVTNNGTRSNGDVRIAR